VVHFGLPDKTFAGRRLVCKFVKPSFNPPIICLPGLDIALSANGISLFMVVRTKATACAPMLFLLGIAAYSQFLVERILFSF